MIPRELIEKLRYIEIYTLKAVRDLYRGDYASTHKGRGFEFDQHKRYQHGDDYRKIDWNVTARMQHPYVKREYEDKEMSAIILADLSRSMEFSSAAESKKELLVQMAATLAFSAGCDNMSVGLLGFTDSVEIDLAPKKGRAQVWKILESLWDFRTHSPGTDFPRAWEHLERRLKRFSVLFCISDFITAEDIFASSAFKHLVQNHDFIPLIIEDAWEEALPSGTGFLRLRDPEWPGEMLLRISPKQRDRYALLMRERKLALQRSLYEYRLDHLFLRTGQPYLEPILGLFLARKRLG